MKTFGLVGWSGSGKTTLMVKLLPELTGRGLRVSTMKHTHHHFDIDKPGKDSFEHRRAGASEVLVVSSLRWALIHENRTEPEADMDAMIERMTPVDLLLIEGFKRHRHPKLEVHRPSVGKPLLCRDDPSVAAVATDEAVGSLPVPVLDLNDVPAVANFILDQVGLRRGGENDAA